MASNSERLALEPGSIAVVLIDGNRVLREGLASLLQNQPDLRVLAACADVGQAIYAPRPVDPDVLLMDVGSDAHESLRLTTVVRAEIPATRVILMGLLPDDAGVAAYVRAGASGFIMKDASVEEYLATIRAVAAGAEALPAPLTRSLFMEIVRNHQGGAAATAEPAERLTARERAVVDYLAQGLSNKEIAKRMNIAVHTVKSHVHNILEKLGLQSRLEVAGFKHAAGSRAAPPGLD